LTDKSRGFMNFKKIILVAGSLDPARSYEYHNFQNPLEYLGHIVSPFDFLEEIQAHGREGMNNKLLAMVKESMPDIVIFVPQTDQFIPEIIDEIGRYSVTFAYFYDDMWRIEYSQFWARHFNFVSTSDVNGIRKFRAAGFENVVYSPFACNTNVYRRKEQPKLYDVSFVGQYHPYREWSINYLKKKGINVRVWGKGWPSGMIDLEDMINVFNQSRINLNFSNCVSWDIRYFLTFFRPIKSSLRVWRQGWHAFSRADMKTVEQVKGRHFEINACGGFQLSYYVEGLERMYSIGNEIAIFASPEDLVEKTKYYLNNEGECKAVAQNGYKRTQKDHTIEKRFDYIFEKLDLI
jgi:spore maturation protein CgeB